MDLKVFNILAEAKGADVTAAEIASQSNADARLVVRIMRVLTASGYGLETGVDTYRGNVTSDAMTDTGMVSSFRLA
jgi:DNA-binding IclR family transcriptional regulator